MRELVENGPTQHPGAKYIIRDDGQRLDLSSIQKVCSILATYLYPIHPIYSSSHSLFSILYPLSPVRRVILIWNWDTKWSVISSMGITSSATDSPPSTRCL